MLCQLVTKTCLRDNKSWKIMKTFCPLLRLLSTSSSTTTIYSLSTNIKPVGSAIAVIRISGHKTFDALSYLIKNPKTVAKCVANPRTAVFAKLYDVEAQELLDSSIVICFSRPSSYTGEDMCELHVHGSNAVIGGVLQVLSRIDGLRPSETGEFTKRALMNGKMDLIGVEAINDLIHAQTLSQRRRALSAMSGSVSQLYDNWRTDIIKLRANIEVCIDFGEEELIDANVFVGLKTQMLQMIDSLNRHLDKCKTRSDLIKDGIRVAIIGEPNVGKSSLINRLCERDLSIVSPISGTTRDVVETWINLDGYSVSISDTAGIKDLDKQLDDCIEREGIVRAINRAKNSDLMLVVLDATTLVDDDNGSDSLNGQQLFEQPIYLRQLDNDLCNKSIYIINKIDLLSENQYNRLRQECSRRSKLSTNWSLISCKSSDGFDDLIAQLSQTVQHLCGNPMNETLFINERHEAHIRRAVQQIQESIQAIDNDVAVAAHHLREAAQQIAYITGRISTEDILDVIFRDFCIGK